MTNIKILRCDYDRLTPKERLSLLLEAATRGDDQEHLALMVSAPKEHYTVSHHYFLANAFGHLAAVHVCQCLSLGILMLIGKGVLHHAVDNNEADQVESCMGDLAMEILTQDAAWQRFCDDNGVDPEHMLAELSGMGHSVPDSPNLDALGIVLDIARIVYPYEPSSEDVKVIYKGFCDGLQRLAGEYEDY